MFLFWGALLAAGINYASARDSTKRQGEYNAAEAEKNRLFQSDMSGTAYQRAADDLEAAGLNRMLALGNPASSPAGATASIDNPRFESSISTGIQAASAKQAIAQSRAEENLIKQRENESKANERYLATQAITSDSQAALNNSVRRLNEINAVKSERLTPAYDLVGDAVQMATDKVRSTARELPAAGKWLQDKISNTRDIPKKYFDELQKSFESWKRGVKQRYSK